MSSRDVDGVLSASAFVFPHAADDAVGEVSLVGAAGLAFAEFAVDDYFADWVRRREQRVKRNTRHASGQRNRLYIRPVIGRIPLNKITRGHIEQIHANVAAAGLSPATLRAAHAAVSKGLADAVAREIIPRNVAAGIELPKPDVNATSTTHNAVRAWTVDEQQQFRQFIAGDPLEHLLVFLLGSGLRRGEALGLAWSDITFSDRGATIRVRRSWTVSGTGSPFATTPKNSRQRVVPIGTHTAAAHHRQKAAQNSDRLMVGAGWATATRRRPRRRPRRPRVHRPGRHAVAPPSRHPPVRGARQELQPEGGTDHPPRHPAQPRSHRPARRDRRQGGLRTPRSRLGLVHVGQVRLRPAGASRGRRRRVRSRRIPRSRMTAMPAVCRNFPTRFAPKLRVVIVSDTADGPHVNTSLQVNRCDSS